MPYAVVSDLHCHKWSAYSTTNADGVNSRLRIILEELKRTAQEIAALGGSTLVIAGDVFHVRGSLDPEVLNPTQAVFREIMDMGISIYMIPGNHDLAGKETTELGSAIQTLSETFSSEGSIRIFNAPTLLGKTAAAPAMAFVPWCSSTEKLLNEIEELAGEADKRGFLAETDLFIHAGIDGVLPHMPDHGLTAERLAKIGFRNVFAGHYHNHKDLGDGVYSIGATTHQTWSDVGSRAGFLIVEGDVVRVFDTHAPKFVDVTGLDEEEMALEADGNYVRFRGGVMKSEDVRELREFLFSSGAKGVSIQVAREQTAARGSTPVRGVTLEQSVASFVDTTKDIPAHVDRKEVKKAALEILANTRTVREEA